MVAAFAFAETLRDNLQLITLDIQLNENSARISRLKRASYQVSKRFQDRYGRDTSQISNVLSKRDTLLSEMNNTLNSMYTTKIVVGSRGQSVNVVLDTGSSDTWIRGQNCTLRHKSSKSNSCAGNRFDPTLDQSFKPLFKTFSQSYGTGYIEGQVYNGRLTFGKQNVSLTLGLADTMDRFPPSFSIDGIVGFGFQSNSAIAIRNELNPDSTDVMLQLQNAINGSKRMVGFYFSDYQNRDKGQVTFGGVDASRIDPTDNMTFYPVLQSIPMTHWMIDFSNTTFKVGNLSFPGNIDYPTAVVDTGATLTLLDQMTAFRIHDSLNAKYDNKTGVFIFPNCSTIGKPNVELQLGKRTFQITPQSYVLPSPNPKIPCFSAISFASTANVDLTLNFVLIGQALFRDYYTLYDAENLRVGFVKAKHPLKVLQ